MKPHHTFIVIIADDSPFPHGPDEATAKVRELIDRNFTAGANTVTRVDVIAQGSRVSA